MIAFEKFVLDNGLRVLVHEDDSTQLVAVNVLYDVGSRDENPEKTGFAHLFEHLMFGGSANVPDFDEPIQVAGGENNAFTNSDLTNYYDILPLENIETALWLESDRMKSLDFSLKSLNVQKKVVVEEFYETCLNQPYGDVWHHLSEMIYKNHSYKWPTIGKVPDHIKNAQLDDVKDFFYKYYRPNNAILVLAGNIKLDKAKELAKKWFEDVPSGDVPLRNIPMEVPQRAKNSKTVYANIPVPAIYLAFPMEGRLHKDYYACDLLSDFLSNGRSSRFYQRLYKGTNIFTEIDAYISGTFDPGIFIVEAKLMQGASVQEAIDLIWKELEIVKKEAVSEQELQKIKNKIESSLVYSEVSILNKAISLAYFEVLGDAAYINDQGALYEEVSVDDIQRVAQRILTMDQCNELIYLPTIEDA